jgi:hypothetical protein
MQIDPTSFVHDAFATPPSSLDAPGELDIDEPVAEHIQTPPSSWTPVACEAEILGVLQQPASEGEPRELAFKRKEHQLAALFAQLVPAESLALEERLRLAQPGDAIATQFRRFVVARQERLLAFLAQSRKRHPLQQRQFAAVGR